MYSSELKAFIKEKSNLFWYTPESKKEDVSPGLLVETILNYGTMDDVRTLIKLMGIKDVSRIFFSARGRQKLNYYPEIYNFFSLLFKKYAEGNPLSQPARNTTDGAKEMGKGMEKKIRKDVGLK
jgi:hypothetical protein